MPTNDWACGYFAVAYIWHNNVLVVVLPKTNIQFSRVLISESNPVEGKCELVII